MSLNKFTDLTLKPWMNIHAEAIQASTIEATGEIIGDSITVSDLKVDDIAIIRGGTFPDSSITTAGYTLKNLDGKGMLSWEPDGTGSSDIKFTGVAPVSVGELAVFNSTGGLSLKETGLMVADVALKTDYLPLIGGTMTGDILMSNNDISGIGALTVTGASSLGSTISRQSGDDYHLTTAGWSATSNLYVDAGFKFSGSGSYGLYKQELPSTGTFIWGTSSAIGNSGDTATQNNKMLLSPTTLTSKVPILAPVGSVGAPSYSFEPGTNTGIYQSVANTIDFSTGGVLRASINNFGFAIRSNIYLSVESPADAISSSTGCIITLGGIGCAKNLHAGWAITADAQPKAYRYHNATQSIASGTPTRILQNTSVNLIGIINTSDEKWTVATAGTYNIKGSITCPIAGTAYIASIAIEINTVNKRRFNTQCLTVYDTTALFDGNFVLAANDSIIINFEQNSGGPINIGSALQEFANTLEITKLH